MLKPGKLLADDLVSRDNAEENKIEYPEYFIDGIRSFIKHQLGAAKANYGP